LAESDRARADPVQVHGLVEAARQKEGAGATITVRPLRGNISVLMGSGGISPSSQAATETFSSTLVFAGARPKIADPLAGISSDPIKHLINTHWAL